MTKFTVAFCFLIGLSACAKKNEEAQEMPSTSYSERVVDSSGTIAGFVLSIRPIKPAEVIEIQRDQEACGLQHPNVSHPGDGPGLGGALVYLEKVASGKPFGKGLGAIDQKNCEFRPHIQVIRPGTKLTVTNSDASLHNIRVTRAGADVLNEAQPEGAPPREISLTSSGLHTIYCDVHPWMRGFVLRGFVFVAENPYYSVTKPDGSFAIDQVPPGTYTLKVWRDSWELDQARGNEGRIAAYRWGQDLAAEQTVIVAAGESKSIEIKL
jgi:plastocyanin